MSELEKLEKEFELKKEELQRNCKHLELSDWTEEWWAIAHPTGYYVKYCKRCGKTIERKEHEWRKE